MTTLERIKDLLKEEGIEYQEFHHDPVRTSEEAQDQRPEFSLSQGAKALIISLRYTKGKNEYLMLVLPGDRRIDSKKARKILKCRKFSFVSEFELEKILNGVKPGGVPPFGNLFDLPVYVDKSLGGNREIIFNAGDRKVSIAMKYEDWKKIVNPYVAEFVE